MEPGLEIVCKCNNSLSQEQNQFDGTNNSSMWLGFQNILNKIRELTRPEKQSHHYRQIDDDWEVSFERIRMCHNDFQRSGSQGDVFYGRLSNAPVAVKRVKDASSTNIRHLRELDHKNIIKFKGISQKDNYYYILMEWCPYGTLHDHIHSGKQLSASILSNFAQQIANGMKYLHSKNIIHRDLKPSNILLTHHDVLKISDFGTHKVFNDKLPETSKTYAGTHAYMAPEVIRSDEYSFPVDVWSFGVVLLEMLTGYEPYKNLEGSAVVWAVGNCSFHLPIPHGFPEGFNRILSGCWRAKPSERLTFQQICIILKGAKHEVDKTPIERWLPLQAEWRREIRKELNKHLQKKSEVDEDQISPRERRAHEEAIEQVQKEKIRNNDIYLRLQECSMHMQREKEEADKMLASMKQAKAQFDTECLREREEIAKLKEEALRDREEAAKLLAKMKQAKTLIETECLK